MYVCDSSALVPVVLETPVGDALSKAIDFSKPLNAPDIFAYETCNAMWKYMRANQLSEQNAAQYALKAFNLIDISHPCLELYEEALALAAELKHQVYDVFYLVLARRLSATLVTCDKRLARLAQGGGIPTLYGYDLLAS